MTSVFRHVIQRVGIAVLISVAIGAGPASAAPIASLEYVETALGGGLFQYDYTLTNLADPTDPDDAGRDIWDLFVAVPEGTLTNLTTPSGWDLFGGGAGFDFLEAVSAIPGARPVGTDIGPGSSLGGFTLFFSQAVGSLPFSVTFANPSGPETNLVYDGLSTAAVQPPSPVPEPGSLLLLTTGIGSLLAVGRRRRRCAQGRLLINAVSTCVERTRKESDLLSQPRY